MMTPPTDNETEQFVGMVQRFANQQRLFAALYTLDNPPQAQVRNKLYIQERRKMLEWSAISIISGPTSRVFLGMAPIDPIYTSTDFYAERRRNAWITCQDSNNMLAKLAQNACR